MNRIETQPRHVTPQRQTAPDGQSRDPLHRAGRRHPIQQHPARGHQDRRKGHPLVRHVVQQDGPRQQYPQQRRPPSQKHQTHQPTAQPAKTPPPDFGRVDLPRRNRSFPAADPVEFLVERVVQEHASHVEQGRAQQQDQEIEPMTAAAEQPPRQTV